MSDTYSDVRDKIFNSDLSDDELSYILGCVKILRISPSMFVGMVENSKRNSMRQLSAVKDVDFIDSIYNYADNWRLLIPAVGADETGEFLKLFLNNSRVHLFTPIIYKN